jgi:hypothetical protein
LAAQVQGARQRPDKHGKVPRELRGLVLPPDGIRTRHIISHDLIACVHGVHYMGDIHLGGALGVPAANYGRPVCR